ncbi:MAG TPA: hypothetical protein VFM31_06555 [Nitrososphaeraceae archaeon]|nr:hypothetical protein [Nitrososphaeraceae archaeon]
MTDGLVSKTVKSVKCPHSVKDNITFDHEIICKSCGAVLGMDDVQNESSCIGINLFQEVQPGCKPVKLELHMRNYEQKYLSSLFSNACDKLNLPRHVSLTAWNAFIKILKNRRSTNQYGIATGNLNNAFLSRASIALFTLFISCRQFQISKSENEIRDAVGLAFSVKCIPTMLRIFSIIKPTANNLGIKLDEDHLDYYLNVYLKKYNYYNVILPNNIKQQARIIASSISGSDESKARYSVKIVLAGMGIKHV